jgi:hypothetical protein
MSDLTEKEAYLAMFAFLEGHYMRTQSGDVGALLGSLALLPDGGPADSAVSNDWAMALSDAKAGRVTAGSRLRPK